VKINPPPVLHGSSELNTLDLQPLTRWYGPDGHLAGLRRVLEDVEIQLCQHRSSPIEGALALTRKRLTVAHINSTLSNLCNSFQVLME